MRFVLDKTNKGKSALENITLLNEVTNETTCHWLYSLCDVQELTLLGKLKAFVIVCGWGLFFRRGEVGRVPCRGSLLLLKVALYVDVSKGSFEGYS